MLPFLRVKREQALIILDLLKKYPGRIRWTREALQDWGTGQARIKELNKSGTALPRGAIALHVGDQWMTPVRDLFGERWEIFSETFPSSGMMRNGVIYELPPSEPPIDVSASSSSGDGLLPTPTAQLNAPAPWKEGVDWWLQSRATRNLEGVVTGNTPLLPTPVAMDANMEPRTPEQIAANRKNTIGGAPKALRETVVNELTPLLPTPVARDYMGIPGDNVQMASLPREISLLPTPSAGVFNDGEDLGSWRKRKQENLDKKINGNGQGVPLAIAAQDEVNWGRYSSAIFFWENVLARKAPVPTEPTGRNGNPRLSPRFVEFMMGLPEGWVTDVPGLKRRGQLHSLGNGVVPQQAEMALRLLLAKIPQTEEYSSLRENSKSAQYEK